MISDRGVELVEPARWRRDDVPAGSQHFFGVAPALAVHEGPWTYSRRPRLGMALKISGAVVAAVLVAVVIADQVREDTLLEGQLIVAGFAFAFLAWILLASPGAVAAKGKLRYQPSGRTLTAASVDYRGTVDRGTLVHAALKSTGITRREIEEQSLVGSSEDRLCVAVYWSDRDDIAFATVHLETAGDDVLVWPPVQIPRDQVAGLLPRYEEPGPYVSYPNQP